MAYKGKHIVAKSALDFNKQLVDFLLTCGWVHDTYSPTIDETARIAQDDKHGFILGWFLKSNGEDGLKDLPIHVGWQTQSTTARGMHGTYSYLTAGITDTDTTIPAVATTGFSTGDVIQIGDECILVGSISSPNFIACTRGYYGTTAVAHSQKDVIARCTDAQPGIMVYGFRDIQSGHGILTSDPTSPDWLWTTTTVTAVKMTASLSATRDTSKVDNTSLVRVTSGAESGKMRWITAHTAPEADHATFTFSSLYTAPAAYCECEVLSAGWFPHVSRHMNCVAANLRSHTMYLGSNTLLNSPKDCWLYGSKDGVAVVMTAGNGSYICFYWGTYVPFANTAHTTAQAASGGSPYTIPKGATQIKVANVDLFAVGGRYVIFSQNYLDWIDNRDCYSSTYMGAGGTGQWANLDGDETAFEHVVVTAIDDVNSILTLNTALCYSYRAGAVIGEDPRPHCGYAHQSGDAAHYVQFGVGLTTHACTSAIFHTSALGRLATHPCHRIRWRCGTNNTAKFKPDGTQDPWGTTTAYYSYFTVGEIATYKLSPYLDYDNRFSRGHLVNYQMKGGNDATWYQYGGDQDRLYGIVPQVYYTANPWGGVSEDTIKVMWNGQPEIFRLFYDTWASQWRAFGPEIA